MEFLGGIIHMKKDLPESSLRQKYLMKSGIPLYTAENFTIVGN